MNLGRPLARSPVNDESGQHLYVLGRQDCLFVLSREPLSCTAVVYLGHADASIPCAPARLGQFLVVPENDSLYNSQLHVLVLDKDGAKVRPVQDVDVAGWTWQTPASAGPIVWGLGDKGGYEAFSVGDYTNKTPFRSLAKLTADSVSTGPALRPGAIGSRALGGFGAFRATRPRPRAGLDPDSSADPSARAGAGADPEVRKAM